jgi:pyruvate formate-lyase activating enzyme-like uncharacterized protein
MSSYSHNGYIHPNIETMYSNKTQLKPITTHNQQYIKGNVNSVSRQVVKKYINIDSRFKRNVSDKSSDFEVILNANIDNVVSMRVLSTELPNTIYNITPNNNSFWITNSTMTGLDQIDITPGKYDVSAFINYLVTQYSTMFYSSNLTSVTPPPALYDINHDTITGKFTIRRTTIPEEKFTIQFINDNVIDTSNSNITQLEKCGMTTNPRPSAATKILSNCNVTKPHIERNNRFQNLGYFMGFNEYKYSGVHYYESENVANFSQQPYLYLSIDDYNNNNSENIIGNDVNSLLQDNIISRFSIKSNSTIDDRYDAIFNSVRVYHGPVKLKRMKIKCIDIYGNVVDFNGSHISLLLEVETLYNSSL